MAEFTIKGIPELEAVFKKLPQSTSTRVRKTAITKTAGRFRTLLRRDAPRISGMLRKSIGVKKSRRFPAAWIGLKLKTKGKQGGKGIRYYYKVLDMQSKRGAPIKPWFFQSADRHIPGLERLLVAETKKAVVYEAGKAFARQRRGR